MPYNLRPTALLLPRVFYQLPDDILYSIALHTAISVQLPRHRYRLRARTGAMR